MLAEIMAGNATEVQIAAFLIALRTKGETVDELAGLARTMRALAARSRSTATDLLDTAGTGGGRRTFNVSTTAALIAAGAGCTVAKHGNRSATGLSGSADVLEALGARIDLGPAAVGAVHRGGRLRLHVRARPPPGHALRDPRPQRARGAHDLQLPRPADQSGGRGPAADRRLRSGVTSDGSPERWPAWAPATRWSSPARTGSTSSASRRRRASSRSAAASCGRYSVTPEEVGLRRAAGRPRPGRRPGTERRDDPPRSSPASPERRAISPCSTPARRSTPAVAPTRCEAGVRAAEVAIDTGAAAGAVERFVARTRELAPA